MNANYYTLRYTQTILTMIAVITMFNVRQHLRTKFA